MNIFLSETCIVDVFLGGKEVDIDKIESYIIIVCNYTWCILKFFIKTFFLSKVYKYGMLVSKVKNINFDLIRGL